MMIVQRVVTFITISKMYFYGYVKTHLHRFLFLDSKIPLYPQLRAFEVSGE